MQTTFAEITGPAPLGRLPIQIEQTAAGTAILARAMLLVPMFALAALPLTLIAAHAIAEPASLAVLGDRPLAAAQVAAGMLLWTFLFVRPLQRMLFALGRSRSVRITADRVSVVEAGVMQRQRTWSEPISGYRGIARHVRSTVSGVRHELILVHRDRARHVLLAAGDAMPQSSVDQLAGLLRLPEISARALYWRGRAHADDVALDGNAPAEARV